VNTYEYDANGNRVNDGYTVEPAGGNRMASDAAGWGWFVDSTPDEDEEFTGSGTLETAVDARAVDRIDLLSVVMHELGHALDYDDLDGQGDLMSGLLAAGTRRTGQE
jgi:hypothetical protein